LYIMLMGTIIYVGGHVILSQVLTVMFYYAMNYMALSP